MLKLKNFILLLLVVTFSSCGLETMVSKVGFRLIERLTVYPKFNTPHFLSSTIREHMARNVANFYQNDEFKELVTA